MNFSELSIDRSWTLFLDRDGVINRRVMDGYVTKWEEFDFLPGVVDALAGLSGRFGRIIVVSNQQGVGKGIMSKEDVDLIHERMMKELENSGGRIDAIYFSPHLSSEENPMRKPGTGMFEAAVKDFPKIDAKKSLMVGDTPTDILFGEKAGMYTVMVGPEQKDIKPRPDFTFPDLSSFARAILRK